MEGANSKRSNFLSSKKLTYEEIFRNLIKSFLSFEVSLESSTPENLERLGKCHKQFKTLRWIFCTYLIRLCYRTAETHSFCIHSRSTSDEYIKHDAMGGLRESDSRLQPTKLTHLANNSSLKQTVILKQNISNNRFLDCKLDDISFSWGYVTQFCY